MKNVYLVQVDVYSDTVAQVVYLPYAAGLLAACAWKDDTVKKFYNFGGFVFKREAIDKSLDFFDNPYLIGFSNYCWSAEYNKLLAKKVKEKYPECIIVFGGHDIPDNTDFLREYPFVDILMHGEGEYNFRELLKNLIDGDISKVFDITYKNSNGEFIRTAHYDKPRDLNEFPSPYLEGWFDGIVKDNPELVFNAILETSRGCPNRCAYCDWGLLKSKTRIFSLDRVKAEIKWMSENKIVFIWGADANFGMFKRDELIADELIKYKKENGYPEKMRMNYSKANFENVFKITKKLCENDCDRIGSTMSFQSLSPEVLHNIGRTNMSFEFFIKLLKKYRENHIKTYSELLLGLPGETYQSFVDGLCKLLELGQHFIFCVYACILLPNSLLGRKDMIEKYGIKTVKTELLRCHTTESVTAIPEYENIITSTLTLSKDDWARASVFYWFLTAMHASGLVRVFAIYLYYEKGVKYQDFYHSFINFTLSHPDFMLYSWLKTLCVKAEHMSKGEKYEKLTFEPTGNFLWNEYEYIVLNILEHFDEFYEQFRSFIVTYGIDEDILADLFSYQKAVIRKPCDEKDEIELNYDIHEYLSKIYLNEKEELRKLHHKLILKDSSPYNTWTDFGKYVVWYGCMGWQSYKDDISKKIL